MTRKYRWMRTKQENKGIKGKIKENREKIGQGLIIRGEFG